MKFLREVCLNDIMQLCVTSPDDDSHLNDKSDIVNKT